MSHHHSPSVNLWWNGCGIIIINCTLKEPRGLGWTSWEENEDKGFVYWSMAAHTELTFTDFYSLRKLNGSTQAMHMVCISVPAHAGKILICFQHSHQQKLQDDLTSVSEGPSSPITNADFPYIYVLRCLLLLWRPHLIFTHVAYQSWWGRISEKKTLLPDVKLQVFPLWVLNVFTEE